MMAGLVPEGRYRCGTVGESNSTSYPLFSELADPLAGQSTVEADSIPRTHSRKVDNALENTSGKK